MAAANPLEDLYSSEIDESAVSALVGSLESRLASPANKDIVHSLSEVSVNNNHISSTGTIPCTSSVFSNVHSVTQSPKGVSLPNNVTLHGSSGVIAKFTNSNSQISGINSLINSSVSNIVSGAVTYVNAHSPVNSISNSVPNQSPNTRLITISQPQAVVNSRNSPIAVNANNVTFVNNVPISSTITSSQMTNHSVVGVAQSVLSNHSTISLPSSAVHSNVSLDQKPILSQNNVQGDLKSGQILIKQESSNLTGVKNERVNSPHIPSQFVKQETQRTHSPGLHIKTESRPQTIQTIQSVPASHIHSGQVTVTGGLVTQATSVHIVNAPVKGQTGTSGSSGVITVRTPGPSPQHVVMRPQIISTQSPQAAGSQMQVVNVSGGSAVHRHSGAVHLAQGKRIHMPGASVRPQQINIAPRPGTTTGTITLPPGVHIPPGAVLMRNEQGQLMFVSGTQASGIQSAITTHQNTTSGHKIQYVRPPSSSPGHARPPGTQIVTIQHPSGQTQGAPPPHTVLRQHTPVSVTASSPQVQLHNVRNSHVNSPVPPISTPPTVVPPNTPVAIQPVPSQAQGASQQQQQHMLDNVKKCKNFLSTLIKLAASQPEQTVKNVRELIQGLIDGKVEPEMFTERLQIELKSSPQPYLVPFLKKSLPLLRQSLVGNKMNIEGVRAPPLDILQQSGVSLATTLQSGHAHHVTNQHSGQNFLPQPHQMVYKGQGGQIQVRQAAKGAVPISIQNRHATSIPKTVMAMSGKSGVTGLPTTVEAIQGQSSKTHKEKPKYEALKDDDDINDVATMGGVNLSEESRNILASNADIIGTQIRSCKDEMFLFHGPLINRINALASKHGIDDVPNDVINLVSHATQERLRDVLEKLATIAEHRIEIYKMNDKFEVTKDVRSQLKFLEELDKLEKKRHEEQEWEKIMKAARSRSKNEDPEQQKIKQKAKELQQAEIERTRQEEANATALAAIGPRKKRKTDFTESSQSSSSGGMNLTSSSSSTPRGSLRPRIKRVTIKDVLLFMEQDRAMSKSQTLYKSFLK